MKPPEKIFIRFTPDGYLINNVDFCSKTDNDIEYRLAQWHDAKEPPKRGVFLVCSDLFSDNVLVGRYFGEWEVFDGMTWTKLPRVVYWMPLPEPQKDEWGRRRTHDYPYEYRACGSTYIPEPPKESNG